MAGHGLERGSLGLAGVEQEDRIESQDDEPELEAAGQLQADQVGFDHMDSISNPRFGLRRLFEPALEARQHGRIDVDRRDLVAVLGQRHRHAPRSGGQLEYRPAGPRRQGEVEVDVAGVVKQVHVVQPGQCGGRLWIATQLRHPLQRSAPGRRPEAWRALPERRTAGGNPTRLSARLRA